MNIFLVGWCQICLLSTAHATLGVACFQIFKPSASPQDAQKRPERKMGTLLSEVRTQSLIQNLAPLLARSGEQELIKNPAYLRPQHDEALAEELKNSLKFLEQAGASLAVLFGQKLAALLADRSLTFTQTTLEFKPELFVETLRTVARISVILSKKGVPQDQLSSMLLQMQKVLKAGVEFLIREMELNNFSETGFVFFGVGQRDVVASSRSLVFILLGRARIQLETKPVIASLNLLENFHDPSPSEVAGAGHSNWLHAIDYEYFERLYYVLKLRTFEQIDLVTRKNLLQHLRQDFSWVVDSQKRADSRVKVLNMILDLRQSIEAPPAGRR